MPARWAMQTMLALAAWFGLAGTAAAGPALVYDAADGKVLYAEDADHPWFAASLTKLMTAYVVFEGWRIGRLQRDTKITMSAYAASQPRMRLGLGAGKQITLDDAVIALIMKSGNDVATAIAEAVSGSEPLFVEEMNKTAQRLGLHSTRFINPHGLPGDGQYTTAEDLAKLTRAIERDFPQHLQIFAMREAKIGKRVISTHNSVLVSVVGGDGMKTGFTCSAGYNIVASASRDGHRVVAVVLGEKSKNKRATRAAALLEHGFRVRDWKSILPGALVETLPDTFPGTFDDRQMLRAANLDERLKHCLPPEPPPTPVAVAAVASPLPVISGKPAKSTKVSTLIAPVEPEVVAAPAKPPGRKTITLTPNKRAAKKRRVQQADSQPLFSLGNP